MMNQSQEYDNSGLGNDKRTYRKKKAWCFTLNITVETPELDNRLNESFKIEIGSNQRLKILMQTIIGHVKNLELRELINKEKMYIYIEGKEPVSRKSKSLAEMGVNDGDNLIVTTEMKLPFDEISDSADEGAGYDVGGTMFPNSNPTNNNKAFGEIEPYVDLKTNKPIDVNADKSGLLTPPNFVGQPNLVNQPNQYDPAMQGG
jgi:uncharacterized ubiquitin-like protein YukD